MFVPHVNRAKIINLIYRQNIGNHLENWYICFSVRIMKPPCVRNNEGGGF